MNASSPIKSSPALSRNSPANFSRRSSPAFSRTSPDILALRRWETQEEESSGKVDEDGPVESSTTNTSDESDHSSTLSSGSETRKLPYVYVPTVHDRTSFNTHNICNIGHTNMTIWGTTNQGVRPVKVEVKEGVVFRQERYFPQPMYEREGLKIKYFQYIDRIKDLCREQINEATTTNRTLDINQKRMFLCSYAATTSDKNINYLYNMVMMNEVCVPNIPITVNGKPTLEHGRPKWVIINLIKYVSHKELPLPLQYVRRASTCTLFNEEDMFKMHREDSMTTYEKYAESTVTISTVNEKRVFSSRIFITNVDPGVNGIMIMPHYADPNYGPVNLPDAIQPRARYTNLTVHFARVPKPGEYDWKGLFVMYVGGYVPLLGIIGIIEFYTDVGVYVLLELVDDYPEERILVSSSDLVVIYDKPAPVDTHYDRCARRAWLGTNYRNW